MATSVQNEPFFVVVVVDVHVSVAVVPPFVRYVHPFIEAHDRYRPHLMVPIITS